MILKFDDKKNGWKTVTAENLNNHLKIKIVWNIQSVKQML